MKVVFLGNLADAPYRIAKSLRARSGHDVQLYTRADAPLHDDPWFHVLSEDRFARLNQVRKATGDCDVVHAFSEYIWYPHMLHRSYVAHSTGSDLRETVIRTTGLKKRLLKRAFSGAAAILYHQPDQGVYLEAFPRVLNRFVHIPFDTDYWAPMQNRHEGPLRVFSPSALSIRQKGSDLIPLIMRQLQNAHLRVVDWGEDRHLADDMDCEKLPRMNFEQMREMYWWADVVIGNLRLGSLGQADFEAMSCEKALIANIDVAKYLMHYDMLPPVTDSSNAGRLLDEGARAELGKAGRTWMKRYHDGSLFAEEIKPVYELAAKGG